MSDVKEKLNEIYKLQNIKSKEWEKLRKKYQKYVEEYNEKVKDLCDFEGKFLKIEDEENYRYSYLYCNTVMLTTDLSGNRVIKLRGYGFTYIITRHEDDTFCNWDQFFEHKIYIEETFDYEKEFNKISYSSKEEFNQAFNNMLTDIKTEHEEYMKDIE
jgi:hypothetical protein